MLFCITYISKATKSMSEEDLTALLQESRDWNVSHDLTGMLLYIRSELLQHKEGRFIQTLEGDEADVKDIFKNIQKDKRHFHIKQLNALPVKSRNFNGWSMGFEALEDTQYTKLSGSFKLDEDFLNEEPVTIYTPALDLLKSFYSLNVNGVPNTKR
jgi:hypothetical protein